MAIARWVKSQTRQVEKGERPMKWVRLKQRLSDFECTWAPAPGVGNRLNVHRDVPIKARFGRVRLVARDTQVAWSGDGTEADKSTVHKIRKDLWLDDERGVDSTAFYSGAAKLDAFIIEYRRILSRLAKL